PPARRPPPLLSASRSAPAARDAGTPTTAVAAAFARLLFQEGEARQEVVDSHSRGLDPLPQGPVLLLEVGDPVPALGIRLPARAPPPPSRPPPPPPPSCRPLPTAVLLL